MTLALYAAALLGLLILVPMLVRLRLYLGGRARGVGVVLVDGLLLAQVLLLTAFSFIMARLLGWDPGPRALAVWRVGLLLAFALKPWLTIARLLHWEFPQFGPVALWRRLRACVRARRAAP